MTRITEAFLVAVAGLLIGAGIVATVLVLGKLLI